MQTDDHKPVVCLTAAVAPAQNRPTRSSSAVGVRSRQCRHLQCGMSYADTEPVVVNGNEYRTGGVRSRIPRHCDLCLWAKYTRWKAAGDL